MSFYIYIISNKKLGTIYIGYTNDLKKRMYRHKRGMGSKFARRYNLKILVYYEKFTFPMPAIRREKQLKKWNRNWKINLINDFNPNWEDLTYFFE
ncbi:GIY-YIG nuclease family protein [Flagellimonas sp. HMM57]|uniref:GIY-YIG nuclease family protein n=1 Tax=unclassified Flagellimonas TaxID=2644544 RepID=UPI0013CFBDBD|nr:MULTISPECIES: GIY-YIG nuclease family protein [unclassified Flagellimonas]UII76624.1 GIY-YIG nuclease family protein [Flagellimonas sp. HMM57]